MEKSKYIKPQCEDIFLVKGSVECGPGSAATGPPPEGCIPGRSAVLSCNPGDFVTGWSCSLGALASACVRGNIAVDPGGCTSGDTPG